MRGSYLKPKHLNASYTPSICMSGLMSVQNGTSSGCTAVDEHHAHGLSIPHVLHRLRANGPAAQMENKREKMPWEFFGQPKCSQPFPRTKGNFVGVRFLKWLCCFRKGTWALLSLARLLSTLKKKSKKRKNKTLEI